MCNGDVWSRCKNDGSGYEDYLCDPVQGVTCNPTIGACEGPCAPQMLGKSYIGCEYYPTVIGNEVLDAFQFAVAIGNTTSDPADITIEEGSLTSPIMLTVPPGDVVVQKLPWVKELKLCADKTTPLGIECGAPQRISASVAKGAFRLRSTRPVTVYQFSPLDYTNGAGFSYTNDASLLLPTNALQNNYFVASFPPWNAPGGFGIFPSLFAVTATQDSTTVTITTRANTSGDGGAPLFQTAIAQQVTLQRGDVLELGSTAGDLSGSQVVSDKPVQVIGGHYCTFIPQNTPACDHQEESLFPVETLGKEYLVTAPALPAIPNGKERFIRIVSTEPGTNLTFDPAIPGFGTSATMGVQGDLLQMPRISGDYSIISDKKIVVSEFMEGQNIGGNEGDPAMVSSVPTGQYRTEYIFHAPTNYTTNYVNVTAPTGAMVTLDGTPVTGFTAIGASGFGVARVVLGAGVNGNHTITGDRPFGITVYGYGQFTSYWYPGGLNLSDIPD